MSTTRDQSKTIKRTILQAFPIPELPGWEHRMVLLEYPAGVSAPVHYHPIAGPNYVVKGTVISQWEGDEGPSTWVAGQSFLDFADKLHIKAENGSEDEELKMIACYVVKIGEPNVVAV